jgi:hypothetical protein
MRSSIPAAALVLLIPALSLPQASSRQQKTLMVKGFTGNAPVVHVNGKDYVEIESLARITNSSISFQTNQITFVFGAPVANQAPGENDQPPQPPKISKDLLKAGIDMMTAIEEWRVAISNAVQNNTAVTPDWVDPYQRNANSKRALAAAAVVTDADRNVLPLLTNEFNNMQRLSDKYLDLRKNLTYTAPESFESDPLNQQVQNCARGLSVLATGGPYQDVPVCH